MQEVIPSFMRDIPKYSMMKSIRLRPLMYFKEVSLQNLQAFLMGIEIAERHLKIDVEREGVVGLNRGEFEDWVRKKLKKKTQQHRSETFARDKCNGDEVEAFYLWFDWFEEFMEMKDAQRQGEGDPEQHS